MSGFGTRVVAALLLGSAVGATLALPHVFFSGQKSLQPPSSPRIQPSEPVQAPGSAFPRAPHAGAASGRLHLGPAGEAPFSLTAPLLAAAILGRPAEPQLIAKAPGSAPRPARPVLPAPPPPAATPPQPPAPTPTPTPTPQQPTPAAPAAEPTTIAKASTAAPAAAQPAEPAKTHGKGKAKGHDKPKGPDRVIATVESPAPQAPEPEPSPQPSEPAPAAPAQEPAEDAPAAEQHGNANGHDKEKDKPDHGNANGHTKG
jgi:hypothetical protein